MKTLVINQLGTVTNLVHRICAGDRQAESELVERYDHLVTAIICREIYDSATTDDLYQETFRIVLEKIRQGNVREPEKLSAFISGVTRNLVIYHFRRATRQKNLTATEETAMHLPHPASDQFQELLQKEEVDLARQVLKEMANERDIEVLFRFYIAEEEKERICADLGLTSLHFNLVLHRARQRYRDLYERAVRDKQ